MKKIGILTFHNTDNYGAVLQCYSLEKFINRFAKCEVIDYRNDMIELLSSHKRYYKNHKNIFGLFMSIFMRRTFRNRKKVFNEFRATYLGISTKKGLKRENLKALNNSYDAFVTGSDQVWNLHLTGNDLSYFLDFVESKNKRFSYAASIGDFSILQANDNCILELKKFKKISVREYSLKKYLEDNFQVYVGNNIDPVFLLNKEEWDSIAQPFIEKKYLLYFENGECNKDTFDIVRKFARERHLKIYYMANEDRKYRYPFLKHLTEISPTKFIHIIKNADFIVADSFHVIAFSLIYEKEFLYDDRGFYNCRVIDLLSYFKVHGRTVSEFLKNGILHKVDWVTVHNKIEEAKVSAKEYFQELTKYDYEIN